MIGESRRVPLINAAVSRCVPAAADTAACRTSHFEHVCKIIAQNYLILVAEIR